MTYRLDDEGAFWSKVVDAGNEAYGACVRAGQLCAFEGTGGLFSRAVAVTIAPIRVWNEAVRAGLVERVGNGALQLCEELSTKWNPTAERARELREKRVLAGSMGGKARAANVKQSAKQSASADAKHFASDLLSKQSSKGARASGSGSGSDPEGSAEGNPFPDEPALAAEIRKHAVFAGLDADRIAHNQCAALALKPIRLDHVLAAVADCARKSDGLGLMAAALQAKLVGFMTNAKAPREPPASGKFAVSQQNQPIQQRSADKPWLNLKKPA